MVSSSSSSNIVGIAILLWCSGAVASAARDKEVDERVRVVESFSIAKDGALICLPLKLAGREYPFVLDTAATHNVFGESLKPHLGRRLRTVTAETSGSDVPIDLFAPPLAYVGRRRLPADRPVGCVDLSRVRQVAGRDFYGVLGAPFLDGLIVQIDFDRGKLSILEGRPLKTVEQWGRGVDFVRDAGGRPWIMGSLRKDLREPFLIDTGFNAQGELAQDLLDELAASSRFTAIGQTRAETAGGEVRGSEGRVADFAVGPFHHRDLIFGSGGSNKLGLGYLCRYRVTFDFPQEKMYLQEGRQFARPDRPDMSGLYLIRKSGRIEVDSTDAGSPAELAGIQPKDVIVEFQDRPASQLDLFTVRGCLRSVEGKRIELTVHRGEKRIGVTFRLKEKRPEPKGPKPK